MSSLSFRRAESRDNPVKSATSEEVTTEDGFEDFELAKLFRTLVIYGAAGALVGLSGEPLTEGNIVAATGATVLLGEIAERLVKRAQCELERRAFLQGGAEAGG